MMHGGARKRVANRFQHGNAGVAFIAGDTHLDQLVRFQVQVDFLEYGFSQTPIANQHDGTQGVGGCAKGAALLGSNVEFWHGGIVREWPRKNFPKTGFSSILTTHTSNKRNRKVTGLGPPSS